jgi:plasmid rolling circle replication initiator protein Rep
MPKVLENITQVNNSHEKYANDTHCCKDDSTQIIRTIPPLLDTLAQPPTDVSKKYKKSLETLKKRATVKYLQRALILKLIDLNSPLKSSYWNTWHCANVLLQKGKEVTAKYCNNRWCPVCNRIRTAKMINGYLPEFNKMTDPRFVTLTVVNIPESDLSLTIDKMTREFTLIKNVFCRRRGFNINGIRKIEVTYNKKTDEYHPHFHIILDGDEVGEALIEEWLKRFPTADLRGQKNNKADIDSLIELCKYSTKLFEKQTVKQGEKIIIQVNVKALDVIYQALRKRRIMQSMGWVKRVSDDVEEIDSQIYEDIPENINVWTWEQEVSDWINADGELLTGCEAYKNYEVHFDTG